MEYRRLSGTDINVSAVCQGGWSIVTEDFTWGRHEAADSIVAIHASLDAGVNFFDTAEVYGKGESEEILARALGPRRKGVIIGSKVSADNLADGRLQQACEESLRRLRTDYIDLYQIHWPSPNIPLADTLGILENLRSAGKIRAIGVSNFGVDYLQDALAACGMGVPPMSTTGVSPVCREGILPSPRAAGAGGGTPPVRMGRMPMVRTGKMPVIRTGRMPVPQPPAVPLASNQLPYSLLWRPIEHEIQPFCAEHGMSILCYSPLAQGLLAGKYASAEEVPPTIARLRLFSRSRPHTRHGEEGCEEEAFAAVAEIRGIAKQLGLPMGRLALAWLLAQKAVASVVVGGRTAEQAAENARAGDLKLPPDVIAALSRATEKVKQAMGTNADPWMAKSRMVKPGE